MKITIAKTPAELGAAAAEFVSDRLRKVIAKKGEARLLLSTGASQFDTIAALIESDVEWSKVSMFHLDEYVDLSETHPASFRKYLKERFVGKVNLKATWFVDGSEENRAALSREIARMPIDIGLIGIGENAHIAFNDPPADFDTEEPYIIVTLSETCKAQQVGEGWFATPDDVPKFAVSMSVNQIMKCDCVVSCVPHKVKAKAVHDTVVGEFSNEVPATMLKQHGDFHVYLDTNSASMINEEMARGNCEALTEYRVL